MEDTLKLWAVIVLVGAGNYASRLSFMSFFARRSIPPLLARSLQYVPTAMLTALIVPMVYLGAGHAVAWNPRIPAAAVAIIVAGLTRSTIKTLGAGMATLWLLQAVLR